MAKSWASIFDESLADLRIREAAQNVDLYAWRNYWVAKYPHFEQKFDMLVDLRAGSPGSLMNRSKIIRSSTAKPIRLLHLSDLHFTGKSSSKGFLAPLLQDLRNGDHLGIDTVDYLVISGDFTDKGDEQGSIGPTNL